MREVVNRAASAAPTAPSSRARATRLGVAVASVAIAVLAHGARADARGECPAHASSAQTPRAPTQAANRDTRSPRAAHARYDDLDQLSTALGYYGRVLRGGGVPGSVVQRYEQGLGYDEIGNLRRNVQADSIQFGGAPARPRTDTSHDLTYRYAAAHPHAPECVGNRHFDYL